MEALRALPPDRQREEVARIAEIKRRLEKNPLWRYLPHEGELGYRLEHGLPLDGSESRGQQEFHEIPRGLDNGAYVAGNRAGKTHAGVADCLIQTLPREVLPPWLHQYKRWDVPGDFRVRIVGVDLSNWLKKVMLPKIRRLCPPSALHGGHFDKAYNDRDRLLTFADGSWWDFLTHDMDIDAFAGAEFNMVYFDEEPPGEKGRQQYEESSGRLADRDGDMRWTLTPLLGLNFVYYELTDSKGNPRQDDEVHVVLGDIDHNPHMSERGKQKFLKKFAKQPLKMQARKSGRWVHFEGLIYPDYSEHRHVVAPKPVPRASEEAMPLVPIYCAIDPGINENHKAALGFAWHGFDDVLEFFHVWKESGATVADVAAEYHRVCELLRVRPRWRVIDPSALNRNHQTGRSVQDEYRKHRIYTIGGQNNREAGFNAVTERLRSDRIRFHAGACEELIEEFPLYRWKGQKRSAAEDAPKAEPIKRFDDAMDMMRYLVMQVGKPPVREEVEEALSGPQRAVIDQRKRQLGGRKARIGGVVA